MGGGGADFLPCLLAWPMDTEIQGGSSEGWMAFRASVGSGASLCTAPLIRHLHDQWGTALRGSNPAWCFGVWGEVESEPSERGPEGSEDGGKQHFHGNGSLSMWVVGRHTVGLEEAPF